MTLVEQLRLLCDPMSECVGDAARLTTFVSLGLDAAAALEAKDAELAKAKEDRAAYERWTAEIKDVVGALRAQIAKLTAEVELLKEVKRRALNIADERAEAIKARVEIAQLNNQIAEGCQAARNFGADIDADDDDEPKWCVAAAVVAERKRQEAAITKLRMMMAALLEQWDRGPLAKIDYDKIDAARQIVGEQRVTTERNES